LVPTQAPAPTVSLAEEQQAAAANAAFAADLLALVRAEQGAATPGNVFFSPLSVTAALAMTMAGARGQTLAQMQHALRTQLPAATYHPALSQLLRGVGLGGAPDTAVPGVQLAVANRLWAAAGFTLQPAYVTQTERLYHARAEVCQFATDPEGERVRVRRPLPLCTKAGTLGHTRTGLTTACTPGGGTLACRRGSMAGSSRRHTAASPTSSRRSFSPRQRRSF
jgi:hypothetical protein